MILFEDNKSYEMLRRNIKPIQDENRNIYNIVDTSIFNMFMPRDPYWYTIKWVI